MLRHTFVGHQTWMIGDDSTSILVDPILDKGFGNSEHISFEVYPPRQVHIDAMPKVDAIVLTHEHLDHFHLSSLSRLDRQIPFYVGPLMPACVREAIEKLGFKVVIQDFFEPIALGGLRVTLYPPDAETVFWEKRVTQILVENRAAGDVTFVAVDAITSRALLRDIETGRQKTPQLVIVSNNSMIVPPGGTSGNLLYRPGSSSSASFPGLLLLRDLIKSTIDSFGTRVYVAICGDGHVDHAKDFGPFLLSDNKELAKIANSLSVREMAFGPYPGESIAVDRETVTEATVNWISLDAKRHQALKDQLVAYQRCPTNKDIGPVLPNYRGTNGVLNDLTLVEEFLPEFARAIVRHEVGYAAVSLTSRDWPGLKERRAVVRLRVGSDRAFQYALDFTTARFLVDKTPTAQLLTAFPFGLELYLQDMAGILRGEIQIWDIMGRSTRSWYLGGASCCIESLLLCELGELIRPELHAKLYSKALRRLGTSVLAAA